MHISEGILSAPVLLGGGVLAAGGTALGLKRIDPERIMFVALMTSAFFVATLVHVPLGPTSAHLVLNGLLGLTLGLAAFPAILAALLLQALLFQYGGLTTLGVNTLNMALPAVLLGLAVRPLLPRNAALAGALCGAGAVLGAGLMTAATLALTGDGFLHAAGLVLAAHLPIALVEGVVTASALTFLLKVKPELLGQFPPNGSAPETTPQEGSVHDA